MKSQSLRALIHLAILFAFAASGFAESLRMVTVSMRPYRGGRAIVAVKLNGSGPYDFMVDTGATVTVLDTALFNALALRAEGASRVSSTAGAAVLTCSVVKEITLESVAVQNIMVVSMNSPMKAPEYRAVRGILGENFLRHFDILFDNQHRSVTLDATGGLADSLAGERLPVTFSSMAEPDESKYRPMISVKVGAYGLASMLLDSGATDLIVLQKVRALGVSGNTRVSTVNGSIACESTSDTVHFGNFKASNFMMVSCRVSPAMPRDKDGILPTVIFQQVFISHAGSYAIINPTKLLGVPVETAAVTPLPQ